MKSPGATCRQVDRGGLGNRMDRKDSSEPTRWGWLPDVAVAATVGFAALAWGSNETWAMAMVAMLAIAALAARTALDAWSGQFRIFATWFYIPVVLFLLLAAWQRLVVRADLSRTPLFPHTIEGHTTGIYLLLGGALLAIAYVTAQGFETRTRVRFLLLSILGLGIFEGAYGLVQYLGNFNYIWDFAILIENSRGTFINRNHYALFLNLSLCCGLGYLYYRSARLLRGQNLTLRQVLAAPGAAQLAWTLLWLALIGLALVMSMSRMGIFAMLVSLTLMVALGMASERGRRSAVLATVLLGAILGLSLYTGIEAVLARYESISQAGSLERNRLPIWREAWKMIGEQPWFGQGLGTFQWSFTRYERHQADVPARYAHNDYLQALSEVGIVGLALLLAAFVAAWQVGARNLYRSEDPMVRGIGLATLGALTAAALQEATDFSLYIPGVSVCFAALLGINLRAARLARQWEDSAPLE